jgi:hypothetical protein
MQIFSRLQNFFLYQGVFLCISQITEAIIRKQREQHPPTLQGIQSLQDGPEIPGLHPAAVASGGGGVVVFVVFQGA